MNGHILTVESKIAGIIVAGGSSFRMKTFKQLLPLNGQPAVVQAIKCFKASGIKDIRVVLGHRAEQIIPLLQGLNITTIVNDRYEDGMLSSVQAGIHDLPPDTKGFFLLPADTPLILHRTFVKLMDVFRKQSGIVYPCFQGVRGHPPLINTCYVPEILNWHEDGGLRALLSRHENDAVDVPVEDQGILLDMDVPRDYLQLCKYSRVEQIPSTEECEILLEINNVSQNVRNHSRAVAEVACELGRRLNAAGCRLNVPLIKAAGLLHDIAKEGHDHAAKGASRLSDYPEVAEIVAVHTDITISQEQNLSEKEVIYLADKLVKEDKLVSLQSRFCLALDKYKDNLFVRQKVLSRLENAQRIKELIEIILKSPLDTIWPEYLRGKENG